MDVTRREFAAGVVTSLSALPSGIQRQLDSSTEDPPYNGVAYLFGTAKPPADALAESGVGVYIFQHESGLVEYKRPSAESWSELPIETTNLTVNGQTGIGVPDTSTSPSVSFDTWRQPNTDRPTKVVISVLAETDGTTDGIVTVDVDETNDGSVDYTLEAARASAAAGSGVQDSSTVETIIPSSGQYRISNDSGSGSNSIQTIREFEL